MLGSAGEASTLRFVWEAERIVTGADHVTLVELAGGAVVSLGAVSRIAFSNGAIEFSGNTPAAEVVRLYATVLGREPDPAGLVFWNDHRLDGLSLAQVAQGFFNSPEFITRFGGLTDETLVVNLYREALGRLPDAAGLQFHVTALQHGLARAELIANFVQSPEAAQRFEALHPSGLWVQDSRATLVGMAYDAVFDRAPDAEGLRYWTANLASGAIDLHGLVSAIAASAEFQNRHAGESDAEYVASIYRSTLEREAEPAGLSYWTDMLAQQRMDRIDVAMLIGISEEQRQQFLQHPHGDAFL